MRIEAYTQVQQIYNSSKVQKGTATAKKSATDQVQFSRTGMDMQVATMAVKGAPDIRMDKVESLKKAIQDGTYEVSGESFAEKLLQKYDEMR